MYIDRKQYFWKDYIGKTITPLRMLMTNHGFDIAHQNSERLISLHAIHLEKPNIEGTVA